MASKRTRVRRKQPSEKRTPFFGKKSAGQESFFSGDHPIQRKVRIGNGHDHQEREAERAAQQVTSQQVQKAEMKEEEPVQKAEKMQEDPVQKQEMKEEEPVQKAEQKEEEKPVQKAAQKEEENPVQAKLAPKIQARDARRDQAGSRPSFESLLSRRKGKGFSLPADIRKEMEGKFRTTFKEVSIHTDAEAAAMCESIHAMAFTHGNDIYFNEGMYDLSSKSGRELLAHELAHVVQQNG